MKKDKNFAPYKPTSSKDWFRQPSASILLDEKRIASNNEILHKILYARKHKSKVIGKTTFSNKLTFPKDYK